jgi:uncharacterized protein YcaQ
MTSLTVAQARRVAVRAQRLDQRRRTAPLTLLRHLGAIQIDSVNVLARAHYLPFYSRLSAPQTDVDRLFSARTTTEYWAHEASLLPVEDRDLFGWRMRAWREHAWGNMTRVDDEYPGILDLVEAEVAAAPGTSREIEARLETDHPRDRSDWGWNWSVVKAACEALFWSGRISTRSRNAQFERIYTPGGLPGLDDTQAAHTLVVKAVTASGVADRRTIKDFYRMPPAVVDSGLTTALSAGDIEEVSVAGRAWYARPGLVVPRTDRGTALLAPFDPLLWDRQRVLHLFGFHYRLEIYTPQEKRQYGYYVLPFLLDGHLVARVDLKADRGSSTLLVRSAHAEPGAPTHTGTALREELGRLAHWLGLDHMSAAEAGDLDLR